MSVIIISNASGGGGGMVDSVTAGDLSIVVGGTASAPTIETGTLDEIATLHPPAGNWSNNSKKITSLANGSGAQDAVAFGQLAAYAPLASPALTGTPTAPTKAALTNNTDLATTAYTDLAVGVETARAEAAEALLVPLSDLPLSVANGGTGQATAAAALSALGGAAINDPLQLGVTGTFTPWTSSTPQSVGGANIGWYVRCASAGYAMSNINIEVGTSAGNISVAAYQSNGSTGTANKPATQYQTSGAVACPAAGVATIALGGSCTPVLADWMGLAADGTVATFYAAVGIASGIALANGFGWYQNAAQPLPAPAVPTAESLLRIFCMRGS
jgi:hypothetical protein